jgi:hypothetical protein
MIKRDYNGNKKDNITYISPALAQYIRNVFFCLKRRGGDVYEGIEKSLQKPTVENPAARAADRFRKDCKHEGSTGREFVQQSD